MGATAPVGVIGAAIARIEEHAWFDLRHWHGKPLSRKQARRGEYCAVPLDQFQCCLDKAFHFRQCVPATGVDKVASSQLLLLRAPLRQDPHELSGFSLILDQEVRQPCDTLSQNNQGLDRLEVVGANTSVPLNLEVATPTGAVIPHQ
jgi:hypothetical protein